MILDLQLFLHQHKNWRELLAAAPYCLTIKEDESLVLFKYNQYESDMTIQICKEARGIIFDKNTLKPVCVPYFKFFNIEETDKADPIDWKSIVITEKIDGSLMKMFWYQNDWHLATNGTINAFTAEVNGTDTTFGDLFVEAIGGINEYNKLKEHLSTDFCYMFELVHPKTQIVIDYGKPQIYLHGVRNMATLNEVNPFWFNVHENVKLPKLYPWVIVPDELIKIVKNMINKKGIVVRDKDFHRVKIKSLDYLNKAFAYNYKNITIKRILKMWREDTLDDFLALVPEKKDFVNNIFQKMKDYAEEQENYYCLLPDQYTMNRKDYYQLAVTQNNIDINYIMKKYDKKIRNPMEYFENMGIKNIERIISKCETLIE